MQHERINQFLLQALVKAGLEPMSFRERLDLGDLTREVTLSAILPGHEWPTRAVAEFSYFWSAFDTARSQGEVEPDPFGEFIDLSCTLKYSPIEEEYTIEVGKLDELRVFMKALVDKLPLALKDEAGDNTAECRVLMGESDSMLLHGPISYQLNQMVGLDEDEEPPEDGDLPDGNFRELEATLRDLAADALRGLMALDAVEPPDGLFARLPESEDEEEEEDEEEDFEDEEEDEDEEDEE